ncbi:MAG: rhodanese-like domain-containing protein [Idiomarina sp.]
MIHSAAVSKVMATPPADPDESQLYFAAKLQFETDCADVYEAYQTGNVDFILLDVRSKKSFEHYHLPGATNLPVSELSRAELLVLQTHSEQRCFVVYCAGTHCNAADKAAAIIAGLGFNVKIMIGGVEGWERQRYPFDGKLAHALAFPEL